MSLQNALSPPSPYAICRLTSKIPIRNGPHLRRTLFCVWQLWLPMSSIRLPWTDLDKTSESHLEECRWLFHNLHQLSLLPRLVMDIQCLLKDLIRQGVRNSCNVQPLNHRPFIRQYILDDHALCQMDDTGVRFAIPLANMKRTDSSSLVLLFLSMQQVSDHANCSLAFARKFISFSYPVPAAMPAATQLTRLYKYRVC